MEALRLEANQLFVSGELQAAVAKYIAAFKVYCQVAEGRFTDEKQTDLEMTADAATAEAVKCLGNVCTCFKKLGLKDETLMVAEKLLEVDGTSAKGYAFKGMGLVDIADRLFKEAEHHAEPAAAAEMKATATSSLLEGHRCAALAAILAPTLGPQLQASKEAYASLVGSHIAVDPAVGSGAVAQAVGGSFPASPVSAGPGSSPASSAASPASPTTPSVGLQALPGRGRGVVALTAVPMHSTIERLQAPVCVGYYADSIGKDMCVACGRTVDGDGKQEATEAFFAEGSNKAGKTVRTFTPCHRCKAVTYCSETCAAEYAARHADECPILLKLTDMLAKIEAEEREVPPELGELGTHLVTALSAMAHRAKGYELLTELDHHDDEHAQSLGPVVPMLCALLSEPSSLRDDLGGALTDSLVKRLLGAIHCNSIQLSDRSGLGVGQALFPGLASFVNHSCLPNAAIDADRRVVRTIRPIMPGEEVVVSYIPQLYWPVRMRREALASRFYFSCHCGRCEGSDDFAKAKARYVCGKAVLSKARGFGVTATGPAFDELFASHALTAAQLADVMAAAPALRAVKDPLEVLLEQPHPSGQGRKDAVAYYRAVVENMAETCRLCPVDEVSPSMHDEVLKLLNEVSAHAGPFSFLLQDLRNSLSFVNAVLGRASNVALYCRQELAMWEALVPGALPVKLDKLRNIAAADSAVTVEEQLRLAAYMAPEEAVLE